MSHAISLKRSPSITTEVEFLTPADARALLVRNTHNRAIQEADVLKWATAMKQGLWCMNGEPIIIGQSGTILDGQHRLTALTWLNDGVRIEFLIVRGVADERQSTMDQGRIRGLKDILTLDGVESDKSLAAAIRVYLMWQEGLLFVDRKQQMAQLSNQWIKEWAKRNGDAVELLRQGLAYRRIPTRPALASAIYARLAERNVVDLADEFFQSTADGMNLVGGSPILALRNRLYRMQGENRDSVRTHLSDRDIIGLFVTAYNAWLSGRSLTKLQRPSGRGYTRETFPRIAKVVELSTLAAQLHRIAQQIATLEVERDRLVRDLAASQVRQESCSCYPNGRRSA